MKDIFKQYYIRLIKIGILRSVLFALLIGAGVNFIVAAITLFFKMSVGAVLGISIGAGILAAVCSALILYFFKFKPTVKSMAAALDSQGLEERISTMVEYENDDSYVAACQRENAVDHLKKVSPKSLRLILPTLLIVLLTGALILSVSMTTVTTLVAADIISIGSDQPGETPDDPNDPDEDDPSESNLVSILYEAGDNGRVDGELFQEFIKGGDGTTVVAIPDEGYEFSFWTDGIFTAERKDRNVTVSFSAKAIFKKKVVAGEGGDGPGHDGNSGSGSPGNGQQGGSPGSGQGGEGSGGEGGEGMDGSGGGGGGAGGSSIKDNNTVIDGETDYTDALDYEAMKEQILADDSLSQEDKDMLLAYLKILMGDKKEE